MVYRMTATFNIKYLFLILSVVLLFSCSNINNKESNEYRVEYWTTDYHRKQIIPNILIDTIFDEDILVKTKWIQINKNSLDSALLNISDGYFDYNDSIYCEVYDSNFAEYSDTSFYILNIDFVKNGAVTIVDVTYDFKKGILIKYYPEKGYEILLKRFYYEDDKLVKVEDFHELQEMNREFNEKFYYRKKAISE